MGLVERRIEREAIRHPRGEPPPVPTEERAAAGIRRTIPTIGRLVATQAYSAGRRPSAPPGAQSPAPKSLAVVGPLLWGEIHRRALAYSTDEPAERRWLAAFAGGLPCGACRTHWGGMLRRTPPDLSSREAYWAWTVARHNETNRKLEKPEMGEDEALAIWDRDAAPAHDHGA